MTQRNISSYLPIIYLFAILTSIFIIHLTELIGAHYHQIEIRNIDKKNKKLHTKRPSKKRPVAKISEPRAQKVDSTMVPSDTILQKELMTEEPLVISDTDFFSNMVEEYYAKRENTRGRISRTDVVIRYYKKEKDKDRVYQLRNLGFYIHERPAEDDFDDFASNAIFYGDSIKREDLILIAYNMMQNGINLQSLKLSKFHDAWKANSVEIGTDTTALDKKPFTLAVLREKWESM
ncbi:MAG: hypothetical protein ABJH98_18620 [Reichenbachiella sp.]|uniref:hypothetical protein n=1 Tax=Reichenbachiella sp. TaxID=2184521 RepID=UPI003299D7EC